MGRPRGGQLFFYRLLYVHYMVYIFLVLLSSYSINAWISKRFLFVPIPMGIWLGPHTRHPCMYTQIYDRFHELWTLCVLWRRSYNKNRLESFCLLFSAISINTTNTTDDMAFCSDYTIMRGRFAMMHARWWLYNVVYLMVYESMYTKHKIAYPKISTWLGWGRVG